MLIQFESSAFPDTAHSDGTAHSLPTCIVLQEEAAAACTQLESAAGGAGSSRSAPA